MSLPYGFAKAKIIGPPQLTSKRLDQETQYHQHLTLDIGGDTRTSPSMSGPTTQTTCCATT